MQTTGTRTTKQPERQRVEQSLFQKYFEKALKKDDTKIINNNNNNNQTTTKKGQTTVHNDFNDTIKEVRNTIVNPPKASCMTAKRNLPITKKKSLMATNSHKQLKKIGLEEAKLRLKKDSERIQIEEISDDEEGDEEDAAFIVSDNEEILSEYEPAEEIEDSDLEEEDLKFELKQFKAKQQTDEIINRYQKKRADNFQKQFYKTKKELNHLEERFENIRESLNECATAGLKQSFAMDRMKEELEREKAKNKKLKEDIYKAINCMNESDESNARRKIRARERERHFLDFLAFYSTENNDLVAKYEEDLNQEWNQKPPGLVGASRNRAIIDEDLDDLAWSSEEEEEEEEKEEQEY